MYNIKKTSWLSVKYKPVVKNPLADLLGVVGKKARFICDLNTRFKLNLELNT